jgi:rhodanese-related sulfurtransferase
MRFLVLLVILASAFVGAAWAEDPSYIEPQALAERLESADPQLLVLDVRSAAEFDEGHIPGAINVPHDVLGERIAELGPAGERDVVVYCRSGRRSAIALEALKGAGFSRLFHLEGDYLRWSEEGRSVVRPSARP